MNCYHSFASSRYITKTELQCNMALRFGTVLSSDLPTRNSCWTPKSAIEESITYIQLQTIKWNIFVMKTMTVAVWNMSVHVGHVGSYTWSLKDKRVRDRHQRWFQYIYTNALEDIASIKLTTFFQIFTILHGLKKICWFLK